jgi:hypothetical protein
MRWKAFCSLSDNPRLIWPGIIIAAAAWLLAGCSMPDLTRVSSGQFPRPLSCADCHVDIFDEWQHSPHARAFSNPRFRAATDNYRFQQCLGCHAPEPILTPGEPEARPADRELGVVCVSCHLDNGAMVGPLPPTGMAKPHPIRVDPAPFENGKLCGRCHQGTLAQSRAALQDKPRDCRECHMPSVERKATQATGIASRLFVAAEKPATEHRHLFTLFPEALSDKPFTLDVVAAGNQADVTLTNRVPHNLPTGDFGVRIVQVVVEGIDANGVVSSLGRWELTSAGDGFLPPGQSRRWSTTVPAGVRTLRAHIAREGRDGADRVVLLCEEVALP